MDLLHKILLSIHITFGFTSLILFWIPVSLKKGSKMHKKAGRFYYRTMWVVLSSAISLCIVNTIEGNYISALFLGYLSIITSYPLWYSFEILNQQRIWTDRYFTIRKVFTGTTFLVGLGMVVIAGVKFRFMGMGTTIGFFGLLGIPTIKDFLMKREKAIQTENRMAMHIKGTIISGIAAYTAFLAFGGNRLFVDVLQLHHQWMTIPWVLPTVLGVIYMRYMSKKYGPKTANKQTQAQRQMKTVF